MHSQFGAYLSLPLGGVGSIFGSWSNPCNQCLCLGKPLLDCFFLCLREPLKSLGDKWIWGTGGICRLQGLMGGIGAACLQAACALVAMAAQVSVGGAHGFTLRPKAQRLGFLTVGAGPSSLDLLCVITIPV